MSRPADTDAFYRELWDRHGYEIGPVELRRWRRMRSALRRHAPPGRRLLDYGCGSGLLIPVLQEIGDVDAYDVTPSVIEEVRRRHPSARVVCGDGSFPSPLESSAYDLVVSSEVIEHVEEQAAFLADIRRLLRPGGVLVLTTPNGRWEERYKAGTSLLQPVENWLDAARLAELAHEAGLEVLEQRTFAAHWANMPYRRFAPYRVAKRAGRRLGFWDRVEEAESRLAGLLGRGITLLLTARRPPTPAAGA